jgi:predicted transcriptional regulator
MNNLPAETLQISPEALEVANSFLETQSLDATAERLGITKYAVSSYLDRREVKAYVDNVFYNLGYNNRVALRTLMDKLIADKLAEMIESGTTSKKDIADLIALSHKITMGEAARDTAVTNTNIKTQTNVQINAPGGANYNELIEKLIKGG